MDEVNSKGERKRDNEEKKKERQRVFASVRKEREEK